MFYANRERSARNKAARLESESKSVNPPLITLLKMRTRWATAPKTAIRQHSWMILLLLSVWLMGCTPPASTASSNTTETNLGQVLPTSAQVKVGSQVIQLEVAETPEQQQMGLMYRTSLPDDRGMLFSFAPARQVGFWMKNVRINLDMVFLRNGKVVDIASNVPPCTSEPCPIYGPRVAVDQVIELRGGRAAELGLRAGDRLTVETAK